MSGIEVAFSGLMLICFSGQHECPTSRTENTAWVIRAKEYAPGRDAADPGIVCGRKSKEATTLKLTYLDADFNCYGNDCWRCTTDPPYTVCTLPESKIDPPVALRKPLGGPGRL